MKNKNLYEVEMAAILKKAGYKFKTEHRFDKVRRFRFDFVLEPIKTKIAIEVNGGHFMPYGKHTFGKSYESDLEKLNLAQINGWIVLQYVPNSLFNVIRDLELLGKK